MKWSYSRTYGTVYLIQERHEIPLYDFFHIFWRQDWEAAVMPNLWSCWAWSRSEESLKRVRLISAAIWLRKALGWEIPLTSGVWKMAVVDPRWPERLSVKANISGDRSRGEGSLRRRLSRPAVFSECLERGMHVQLASVSGWGRGLREKGKSSKSDKRAPLEQALFLFEAWMLLALGRYALCCDRAKRSWVVG